MARNEGQPPVNGQWRTAKEELNPANSCAGELGSGAVLANTLNVAHETTNQEDPIKLCRTLTHRL